MRVVVVGAGLGGLSAAAHLVGRGHEVTVLERESVPGGRVSSLTGSGFRIDTGPTVLTMPDLIAAAFSAAGADLVDHVTIEPVDPMYRAVFADGSEVRVSRDRAEMEQEIRDVIGPQDAMSYGAFHDWVADLYRIQQPTYLDRNFDSVFDALRPWRAALRLARRGGFDRFDRRIGKFFEDERLRQLFSFPAVFGGITPHSPPILHAVLTYTNLIGGIYAARGGMQAVARGLERAVRNAGATVRYRHPVTRILRDGSGAVNGVEIGGGERLVADAVVCNVDLPVAYRTLLGGVEAPRAARRGDYAPSCVLWVAGVRGEPPAGSARHNIHFGADWSRSYRMLHKRGRRLADPSTLVSLPSLGDPSVAPSGHSAVYALEPVPNLAGRIDWAAEGERVAADVTTRVERWGYPTDTVIETVVDPLDWESMGLERGTPFGLAHTLRQSGPFRPGNVDSRVPGLVFVGSSTQPGIGVPMVLLSGKLAAERVVAYARDTALLKW